MTPPSATDAAVVPVHVKRSPALTTGLMGPDLTRLGAGPRVCDSQPGFAEIPHTLALAWAGAGYVCFVKIALCPLKLHFECSKPTARCRDCTDIQFKRIDAPTRDPLELKKHFRRFCVGE